MNQLIRRSAPTAAAFAAVSASRLTLTALLSSASSLLRPLSPALPESTRPLPLIAPQPLSSSGFELGAGGRGTAGCRGFHSSPGPLGFRASGSLAAQQAVDDFAYEEKEQVRVRGDEGLEIAKLGIADVIVKELAKKGITKLFPIQKAVLEPAMQGRDLIGRAKTGTGKTLAFGIPIIDKIIKFNAKHGRGRNPLALVLAPTRELARQVEKEFKESSDLDTICVYGGSPIARQMSILDYGVDVVVGTPGRVIDLLKRGALNLSEVQFVVLDEADQMLAVGFAEDVEIILEKLPTQRQTMMFSATMPSWIKQLTKKHLNNPLTIDLVGDSDQKLAEGITLYSIVSDNHGKASIIAPLITEHAKGGKSIVFTQTKRDADRLAHALKSSIRCEPLHGDISQSQRERTLSGFRDGRFSVLVATDVAARGLDIPNVDLVIHYELPNSSEIFVHRSGRTGRAGKEGTAVLIYTEYQSRDVRVIEQHVGCRFKELPRIKVEGGASLNMFGDAEGDRFGSPNRPRFGGSGSGRSGGFGSDRYGGFGSSSRSGGFGESGSGRSSFFGGGSGSRKSDDFGGSGRSGGFRDSGRSGGFGNSGRNGGFSDTARSGGFGDSGRFGGFGGSSRSRGFGDPGSSSFFGAGDRSDRSDSSRSGGFGSSGSGRFGFGSSGSSRFGFGGSDSKSGSDN